MPSTKKPNLQQAELSGPIALPTRTLVLIAILLLVVAITMLFYPSYWFSPIMKGPFFKESVIEKVWMQKSLTQCNEDWHQQNIPLEEYFQKQGVTVFDMKYGVTVGTQEVTCDACDCLSGNDLLILVDKTDTIKITDFTEI